MALRSNVELLGVGRPGVVLGEMTTVLRIEKPCNSDGSYRPIHGIFNIRLGSTAL